MFDISSTGIADLWAAHYVHYNGVLAYIDRFVYRGLLQERSRITKLSSISPDYQAVLIVLENMSWSGVPMEVTKSSGIRAEGTYKC